MARELAPDSFSQAAAALAEAAQARQAVGIRGAGSKLGWGLVADEPDLELRSTALDQVLEHNAGDLTAVLQAGVPLAAAQERFAEAGQMLALDPPLGRNSEATIGGVVATGDSGPLRHRYGAPRDLVVGMTVALSDGTVARSGGKVIKNVAGYDLAKLFAGSFGTLGMILAVCVRLHPVPAQTATALGASDDPEMLSRAAGVIARAPLELEAFDVAWRSGRGGVLARTCGAEAGSRAVRIAELMREAGLERVETTRDDEPLWDRQRAGQRAHEGRALLRVAVAPSVLPALVRACEASDATLVGRAALGVAYLELEPAAVAGLRERLPEGAVSVLLDAPASLRQKLDPWGASEGPELELMRRVKQRFDPAHACNPGVFVGGI